MYRTLGAAPTHGGPSAVVIPRKPTNIPEFGGPHGYPTYDWVYQPNTNNWRWQKVVSTTPAPVPGPIISPRPLTPTVVAPTTGATVTITPGEPTPYVQRGTNVATSTTPTPVINVSTGRQTATVTAITDAGTPAVITPATDITSAAADITGGAGPDFLKYGVLALGAFILYKTLFGKSSGSTRKRKRRRV